MSRFLKRFWQHEETGRVIEFPVWKHPGHRWYPIKFQKGG